MNITTLFNINDQVYFTEKAGIRQGLVVGIKADVWSELDQVGGTNVAQPPVIQYKVYLNDGQSVPMTVTKMEPELTGTAPPPQG